MSKAKALVLFDIDGTIMRGAGRHHRDALVEGIRRRTGHVTTLNGVETAGALDSDLIAIMLRAAGAAEEQIEIALNEIAHECQSVYADRCREDLRPFLCRGAAETIGALHAGGAVLGLVTGNLSAIGWQKVELAGLRSFFEVGAFADDAGTRTELARIARERAETRGLIDRHSPVTLIGDHANDIRAAKANGYLSVAVATGVMPLAELAEHRPDILLSHLGELDLSVLLHA